MTSPYGTRLIVARFRDEVVLPLNNYKVSSFYNFYDLKYFFL